MSLLAMRRAPKAAQAAACETPSMLDLCAHEDPPAETTNREDSLKDFSIGRTSGMRRCRGQKFLDSLLALPFGAGRFLLEEKIAMKIRVTIGRSLA